MHIITAISSLSHIFVYMFMYQDLITSMTCLVKVYWTPIAWASIIFTVTKRQDDDECDYDDDGDDIR